MSESDEKSGVHSAIVIGVASLMLVILYMMCMDGINNLFVPRVTLRPPHYSILADGFAVYRDNDTFYLGRAETGLVHRNEKHASVDSVIQRSWGQYHYEQPKRVPVMVNMTRLTPSKWTEEK